MNNDKYYDLIKRGECPNCGGELKELGENIFQCRFCQSKHTRISITLSDKVQQAFEKGNDELALAHFEKAYRQFEKVKELAPEDPDVYWNLALAKNQIQYLKDYRNNENDKNKYRLQPICFDVLSKPFTQDENYKKALELAKDPEQKKSYQERAKEIDYIQKKFREYEKNPEYDFDSFICVKVTKDEQKNTTEDAHAADKVYNFLKSKQRNPFYSEVICNNLAGADYEAMILYALYKAKAMILICFDEAYLETPWVKNEHTRYRRMIQDGLKDPDSLLILYKGTPIERLSIDDHKREGINLANPSAYSSLLDRVDMLCTIAVPTLERKKYGKTKVTKKSVQSTNIQKRTLATIKKQEVTVSDQANLKIMQQMMDSKKYSHALAYGLGLIQDNPSFSDAYVLMFLAQQGVQTLDDFIKSKKPVESFEYFEKALATKENLADRLPLIQALANHANTTVDLKSYQEFISLPDCNDELISGLNNLLFPKLLKSNNVLFFQEMAKTISDQDFYINANLSFAHKNSGKASMVFYQNILDIDPSDSEALFNVFAAKIDFDEKTITGYLADEKTQKDVEESLYKYGFNAFATDQIYEKLLEALKHKNLQAIPAFDFLLSLIPGKENKRFIRYLNEFVYELLWQGQFEEARRHNEMMIAQDPNNDEAYFFRVMIQNSFVNPLEILTLDQDLFDIPDYMNAVKSYTLNHPKEKNNQYLQIQETKELIHDIFCADPVVKKEIIKENKTFIKGIVITASQIPNFIEKKADDYYEKFVKDTGVNERTMFSCMRDVSHSKYAEIGARYATLAQKRVDFFKFILQGQAAHAKGMQNTQAKKKNSYWVLFAVQVILSVIICTLACFYFVPILADRFLFDFAIDNPIIPYLPVVFFFVLYLGMNLINTIMKRKKTSYNSDPMPGDTKFYNIYLLFLYAAFLFIIMNSEFLNNASASNFFTYFALGSVSLLVFNLLNNLLATTFFEKEWGSIFIRVVAYLVPLFYLVAALAEPVYKVEDMNLYMNTAYAFAFAYPIIAFVSEAVLESKFSRICLLIGLFVISIFWVFMVEEWGVITWILIPITIGCSVILLVASGVLKVVNE